MAASIGTETMRGVFKISLVYGFQYHSYYFLYQLVIESRHAKGLFLPFFFGMYTLFDGWGWYVSSFNVSINFSIRFRLMLSMV